MRKRIVVSMLVIALAAALLGGAAFAWFTDEEEVTANFIAGTIDLATPVATELNVVDMAPGDHQDWVITIQNAGTLDMYYRLFFEGGISGGLEEVLKVSLYEGETLVFPPTLLSAVNLSGAWFNEDKTFIPVSGGEHIYTIRFELPFATGDEYQGATWNITLNVQATQKANQTSGAIEW